MRDESRFRERRATRRWVVVLLASFITSGVVVASMIVLLSCIREAFQIPLNDTNFLVGLVLMALAWFIANTCVALATNHIHQTLWPEVDEE